MKIMQKKWMFAAGAAGIVILLAIVAFILFGGGNRIVFESEFKDGTVFEYGQEQLLPTAHVVNLFGIKQPGKDVTYTFTDADGKATESLYPVATCNTVGDWTIKCSFGSISLTRNYKVVDSVAPVIEIGTLPADVYVGKKDVIYNIPAVNFVDSSEINYDKCSRTLYFEGEEADFHPVTGAFDVKKAGVYVYKIHAEDIHGNASDAECTWRAKDLSWTDKQLKAGYLASYDTEDYANLIGGGFINQWWYSNDVKEEYLEEYKGEKGVYKISMRWSADILSVGKIYMSKKITASELGDRFVAIRYRIEDASAANQLYVAGNYMDSMASSAAKTFIYEPGKWQTVMLSAEDLTHYHFVDEDGRLTNLQLGLRGDGSAGRGEIYIASISIAEKLDTPTNVSYSGNTLRWNGVDGAIGYAVEVDGKIKNLDASSRSYQMNGTLYRVTALGDGISTLDSEPASYVNKQVRAGYLSENNQKFYEELTWNNGQGAIGGMEYYESDSFEATYDENENAVRLDMTYGYVCAGSVMQFPKAALKKNLDNIVVRVKVDSGVKRVIIYPFGETGKLGDFTELQSGWNTLVIPKDSVQNAIKGNTLQGLQIMFCTNAQGEHGYRQGDEVTAYLGSVTNAKELDEPTGLILKNGYLSWNKVKNASNYKVSIDGKERFLNATSLKVANGKVYRVTALGDGVHYVDSPSSLYINATVPKGYLMAFDGSYYKELIWNDGANAQGGKAYYESDAFESSYNKTDKAVDLKLTHGYVCAGIVAQFPKQAKIADLNNVAIRIKLDSNVKKITVFPYDGTDTTPIKTFTDLKAGWNTLIIPKDELHGAPSSPEVLKGFQFALYGSEQGALGKNQGKEIQASLGVITTPTVLDMPKNLKISDKVLSWSSVKGAVGYAVYEDGKRTELPAKTTRYKTKGGEIYYVEALGNDQLTLNSEKAILAAIKPVAGYLSENNRKSYQYLVWNNGKDSKGGMEWYDARAFQATYSKKQKAVKLDMEYGYVGAGIVMQFPQQVEADTIEKMAIRVKLDASVERVMIYPYGSTGRIGDYKELKVGWNTLVVDSQMIQAAAAGQKMEGLQIIFCSSTNDNHGYKQGDKLTVYLGTVTSAKALEEPTGLVLTGSKLSWNAVANTNVYLVSMDGETKQVAATSCKVKDATIYQVTALGDGVLYLDSPIAQYINAKLSEGYLAAFDAKFYETLVWNDGANAQGGKPYYESDSFASAYNKKEKAVDMQLTHGYVAAGFVVKFPKVAEIANLNDIAINLKLDGNVKSVTVFPYGGTDQNVLGKFTNLKKGWNTLVVPKDMLRGAADSPTVLKGLQIALCTTQNIELGAGQGTKISASIGSITTLKSLSAPQNLKIENSVLSWDAVSNANGYAVVVDGTRVELPKNVTSYAFTKGEVFYVSALGNGIITMDSQSASIVRLQVADGYLAENNRESYTYLVWNNGKGSEGGMEYYEAQEFAASYDKSEKAIKLDMKYGYVCAGSVMKFANVADVNKIDNLVIRVKIPESVKRVIVYPYGGSGKFGDFIDVKSGWNTFVISQATLQQVISEASGELMGLQMMFCSSTNNNHGYLGGEDVTVYLGSVSAASRLKEPTELKLTEGNLTWKPVENASGYLVNINGETKKVSEASCYVGDIDSCTVTALGDEVRYLDSTSAIFEAESDEGYLAKNDSTEYASLIWNNGDASTGGMQWYEAAAFASEYDATENAIRLDMKFGYVGAGTVMKFKQSANVNDISEMNIRVKIPASVKLIRLYPYGRSGQLGNYTELQEGWNTLSVKQEALKAAVADDGVLEGLQIIFYPNATATNGTHGGQAVTTYIGAVTVGAEDAGGGDSGGVEEPTGNFLAKNDSTEYASLIWNNGDASTGGMQWYEAAAFASDYAATENAIRLDMKFGYVGAGTVMKFKQSANVNDISEMNIRVKIPASVKLIRVYPYGRSGQLGNYTELQEGWNTLSVKQEALKAAAADDGVLEGLQIIFYPNATATNGTHGGQAVTTYVGAVTVE